MPCYACKCMSLHSKIWWPSYCQLQMIGTLVICQLYDSCLTSLFIVPFKFKFLWVLLSILKSQHHYLCFLQHLKPEYIYIRKFRSLLVVEKFSSELQFEPKPSRTEPQVQFKVWKFYWTEPQVQFRVQPKLLWFKLVQTTGFSRAIKAEILVIPNQILDLQTTFRLWLTKIDLIDDKIYFRMVI